MSKSPSAPIASDLLAFQHRLDRLTLPATGLAGDFVAFGVNLPTPVSPSSSLKSSSKSPSSFTSLWLLDSNDLKEVTPASGTGPVGGLRSWVGGCMLWHDQVYTLMDIARVFTDNQVIPVVFPFSLEGLKASSSVPTSGSALKKSVPKKSGLTEPTPQEVADSTLAPVILSPAELSSSLTWVAILGNHFHLDLALHWNSFLGTRARQDLALVPSSSPSQHPWIRRHWQDSSHRVWHELSLDQLVLSPLFGSVRAS